LADPHYPGHHPEDKRRAPSTQPKPVEEPVLDEKAKKKAAKRLAKERAELLAQDQWHLRGALPEEDIQYEATGFRKVEPPHASAKEIMPTEQQVIQEEQQK